MELSCRSRGTCWWDHSLRTLLVTAFLGFWIQRVSGQGSPTDVITAKVGDMVTITIPVTGEIFTCTWYKGTAVGTEQVILTYVGAGRPQIPGDQYTNREIVLIDGSLQITDVLTNYTGNYTSIIVSQAGTTTVTRQLRVYVKVSVLNISAVPEQPIENGSLVLYCNASGTDVSYEWFRDNKLVAAGGRISLSSDNQTLTLSPCNKSDTGTIFTCWASNAVSNSSSIPYNVTISYGPYKPIITADPQMLMHVAGSALILWCTALSYPPALFTWLHNNKTLSNTEQKLLINKLTLSDSGNYTCIASNQVTRRTSSADKEIQVLEPVSIPVIHAEPQSPIENGSLTLSCNASGTAVSYQWYRAGTEVVSDGHISLSVNKQILTLSHCSKSDTGTIFTCWASNAVSNSSSIPYNVTISYGPDNTIISVNTEEQFYADGSPLTLSCSAASYPPALYTWFYNGKSSVGQNIIFNSLTLSDSGNYTCNSTNIVTHLSNYATQEIFVLELLSKPTVIINESQPIENQPVALTCETSNSTTTILWFFNNRPLQPDNNRITLSADNKMLTISRISRSDDGSYQCEVKNPVSHNTSDPRTVTVSYGPDQLVIIPSQNEVKLGTEFQLICAAASYPAALYQWLHNDTDINNPHSTYTKTSSTFNDSGIYTCLASNSVTGLSANVSAIVKVSVTGPPGSGLSGGAIAGIVIAVVVVLIAIIGSIWYFFFKRPASAAQKDEHSERNGASLSSNHNAPISGKANGPAEDVQYTTVKFAPKTEKVVMPSAPADIVYSEVRKK